MQRKQPPGSIQRFFKPALAVGVVDEREARCKGEKKESILDDDVDETENVDANASRPSSSASSPPRPPATSCSVASMAKNNNNIINNKATRIATYSRRKKKAKTATDEETEVEATMSTTMTTTAAIPTTTSTAKPPPPPPKQQRQQQRPRRLTQTHLDLGQASFTCSTCPRCGMVYAPGDPLDEKLHASFHADALEGPRLPPSLTSASSSSASGSASSSAAPPLIEVVSYPLSSPLSFSPSCSLAERTVGGRGGGGGSKNLRGRVLHAPPGPRSLGCAAVRRAIAVAEAALGSVPGWLLGIPLAGSGGGRTKGGGEDGDDGDNDNGNVDGIGRRRSAASTARALAACGKHAFLFECPNTKRVVGIAVVEPLASGTRLRIVRGSGGSEGNGEKAATTAEATATTATTTTTAGAAGAALGIRGVWVAPSHRRRGIATALLDAARARAITYTVVGRRALCVFSQPTEAGGGGALAGSYAGNDDGSFLAYYV